LLNASLKDDDHIQRQVKLLYCAANKLRGAFTQCSNVLNNTLFRAYYMLMCIFANCGAITHILV